jgi:hypothetical protein
MKGQVADKPVVFYHGEATFHTHASGTVVAVVYDVLNHPVLGNEKKVYTSQVLCPFKGGFETLNTLYIQLPRKEDEDKDSATVEEVLDNFDFDKVKQVTDLLNWQYFNVEGQLEVRDLRQMARKLLRDTVKALDKEDGYNTGSGGFYVDGFNDNGKKYLELKFCVTSWDNYD